MRVPAKQGVARRGANVSGAWMATADRNEAPRAARAWTDGRRCGGGEEGKADGEVRPPLTAIPEACRCRAPGRYRRGGAMP